MNITHFSIRRPVGISMIVAFFVVLGLYSYYRIGVELLPALNTPYVTVTVNYPGASADSVEQEIIKPMENALSSVSGVRKMTSSSRYEKGKVSLELDFSANADMAAIDATKKVDAIRGSLPDNADAPVVVKKDLDATPVIELAVTSAQPLSTIYSRVYNDFQNTIQQAGGVSDVELSGGRDREVAIEVDKDKMAAYKLTLAKIVAAVKAENQLLPSGSVYTEQTKSDVRLLAQYQNAADIEKVVIQNADGASVPITAVATVRDQDARVDRYGRINGQDAVTMQIYKNSDANVVQTAANILQNVQKLQQENPDYQFTVVRNDADYVNRSLHNTMGTLFEGLCTTGLVLFLFLRGWRSTAAVMIAIPTSLVSTFFVMYAAGFTFNMMSLMGMTLCVGILVDDSIVVLENIVRHLQQGEEPMLAAENGRNEIGMAAIAITLCDAAVFMPIAFMNSMTGQFFRQFGLTIVFAGLFSLFISFTLTPMLASRFFHDGFHPEKKPLWDFMDKIEAAAVMRYETVLRWSLQHRRKILLTGLAVFLAVMAMIPAGLIGSEYMPKTDESSFQIIVDLPVDKTVEQTNEVVLQLEDKLQSMPEVEYCLTSVGGTGTAYEGRLMVQLYSRKDRSRSVWQVTDEVRRFAAEFKDAKIRVSETQSSVAGVSGSSGGSGALKLEIRGNDARALLAASEKVQSILKNDIAGITDVSSSYTEGMPEVQLSVDREKLRLYGTSLADVDAAFSSAISGRSAGTLASDAKNGGQDTKIEVRFRNADGFRLSDIAAIPLNAGGKLMHLGDVALLRYGTGPVTIKHSDKQRAIQIGANVSSRPLGDVVNDVQQRLAGENLGDGITYRFSGQTTEMGTAFRELLSALLLAMVLIYMLLAVLYESTVTPFIRMFSLPLGLIGAVLLLFLTRNTLNLYSLIGILVMDGIVAKNGTLLLDYTLTLMDRGMPALEAVVEAGKVRLKPIFMTTITMIVGMLPTALAITEGAETRVSMAWVIIGGLLTSTVFTLIVIPIIFLFFDSHPPVLVGKWLRRRLAGIFLKEVER